MQREELQAMTVVQLRAIAKENKIRLGAGIDKAGILEKLAPLYDAPEAAAAAVPAAEEKPAPAPAAAEEQQTYSSLAADVTSVAPGSTYRTWNNPADSTQSTQRQNGYHPAPAWQNRPSMPRDNAPKPGWQANRPVGTANRFGPQARTVQPAAAPAAPQNQTASPAAPAQPAPESAPRLDGYKLGYQAQPQRGYQNRGDYQQRPPRTYDAAQQRPAGGYRPSANQYTNPLFTSQDMNESGSVYQLQRDPQVESALQEGRIPDLLRIAPEEKAEGILEILPDGYGYLRSPMLTASAQDVYINAAQIRRFGLRTGDLVEGMARRQRESDRFNTLMYVQHVNGKVPSEGDKRPAFDLLTAVYPDKRIRLEDEDPAHSTMRLVDLVAPLGYGQRSLILYQPDSDRLSLLRWMSKAIVRNDPDCKVLMLLLDINPEELTEMKEGSAAEIFSCVFGEAPENQVRLSDLILQRAQRLTEEGRNVIILLDSMNKLTRANQAINMINNRPVTNTVTPGALIKPKAFFAAARNTREGGSLTVISTMAVDNGNRIDEIIREEFRGAANMELTLCTPQEEDPISPMPDLQASATRKEDILLTKAQQSGLTGIRQVLASVGNRDAIAQLLDMMSKTRNNADLLDRLQDLVKLWQMSSSKK